MKARSPENESTTHAYKLRILGITQHTRFRFSRLMDKSHPLVSSAILLESNFGVNVFRAGSYPWLHYVLVNIYCNPWNLESLNSLMWVIESILPVYPYMRRRYIGNIPKITWPNYAFITFAVIKFMRNREAALFRHCSRDDGIFRGEQLCQ